MQQLSRLLGVMFIAEEVRGWKSGEGGDGIMEDDDKIFIPLSFMLNPEAREGIRKLVGSEGLAPSGYVKRPGEIMVDLGKVTPEEFKAFVEKNRVQQQRG